MIHAAHAHADCGSERKEPCRAVFEPLVCGSILFDDPDTRTNGWLSKSGEEPERFESRRVPETNVVWITNLSDYRAGQVGLSGRYRSHDFMRTKAAGIFREWGIERDPALGARILGKLFGRVMAVVSQNFSALDLRTRNMKSLSDAIGAIIPAPKSISGDQRLGTIVQGAYKAYHPIEQIQQSRTGRSRFMAFVIPRFEHASKILSTPLPYGPWDEFAEGTPGFPPPAGRIEWLGKLGRPAVVRVNFSGRGDGPLTFVLNGDGREWWTGEEVLAVAEKDDEISIDIVEAHVARGTNPSPVSLPPGGRLAELSPSFGLFAENLWVAAASIGTDGNRPPWSLFLRAVDRIECLRVATRLIEAQIAVTGMGYGTVNTFVPEDADPADILDLARSTGTFPVPGFGRRFVPISGNRTDALRVAYATGAWPTLEKIDDMWWEDYHSTGKDKKK